MVSKPPVKERERERKRRPEYKLFWIKTVSVVQYQGVRRKLQESKKEKGKQCRLPYKICCIVFRCSAAILLEQHAVPTGRRLSRTPKDLLEKSPAHKNVAVVAHGLNV